VSGSRHAMNRRAHIWLETAIANGTMNSATPTVGVSGSQNERTSMKFVAHSPNPKARELSSTAHAQPRAVAPETPTASLRVVEAARRAMKAAGATSEVWVMRAIIDRA